MTSSPAAVGLVLLVSACSLTSLDGLDGGAGDAPAGGGPGTSASTGGGGATSATTAAGDATTGAGASTSAGGGGASTTSGADGGGGAGGTGGGGAGGGGAPPFVSRDLLVRYPLDEASSGTAILSVRDAAPEPLDLLMAYGDPASVAWTGRPGRRGLAWSTAGTVGLASSDVFGTKLEVIHEIQGVTLEAVADVTAAIGHGSRIVHFGHDVGSDLSLAVAPAMLDETIGPPTRLQLRIHANDDTSYVAHFDVEPAALERAVLHAVVDTTQAEGEDRMRVYVDGERLERVDHDDDQPIPPRDATIVVNESSTFVVGNRIPAERSFAGTLHYAAVYATPLADEEIAANVDHLTADDDLH